MSVLQYWQVSLSCFVCCLIPVVHLVRSQWFRVELMEVLVLVYRLVHLLGRCRSWTSVEIILITWCSLWRSPLRSQWSVELAEWCLMVLRLSRFTSIHFRLTIRIQCWHQQNLLHTLSTTLNRCVDLHVSCCCEPNCSITRIFRFDCVWNWQWSEQGKVREMEIL